MSNNERRIEQRKRQIAYGKNTIGYQNYIKVVPKHKRKVRSMETPMTPNPEEVMPNRRWNGLVRAWRKALHNYDPPIPSDTLAQDSYTTMVMSPEQIQSPTTASIRWNNNEFPVIPCIENIDYNMDDDDNEIGQKHVIDSIEKMFCNE